MVDYIDRFSYVEPSLPLWDEADLIMVDDGFHVFLDSICQYFIEYSSPVRLVCNSFLVMSLCGLGIMVIVVS